MLKFLLFLSIFSFALSSNEYSNNLDKYLNYLSNRKVIDEAHISFIKNNALTKKDSIFYFYKIMKILDKDKASQEDLDVLESLLADVSEYVNNLRVQMSENNSRMDECFSDISNIKEEKEVLEKKLEDLKTIIENVKNRLDRSIDYDKNNLRKFLKNVDIKLNLKGFTTYLDKLEISYESDINIGDDHFNLRLHNSKFISERLLYTFDFFTELGTFRFATNNYRRAFVTHLKRQFFFYCYL